VVALVISFLELAAMVAMIVSVIPFRVTVVYNGQVCTGRVSSRSAYFWGSRVFVRIVQPAGMNDRVALVTRAAYGVTWCYGWEGRAACALRALVALTT
jgi:hypothetical protein